MTDTLHQKARSLHNVTVVVTRPKDQTEQFALELEMFGADICHLPLIETTPCLHQEMLEKLSRLPDYDALIVTSANGLRAMHAIYRWGKRDWPSPAPLCYSIGRSTAAQARAYGLNSVTFEHVRTGREFAAALLDEFSRTHPNRILMVHGDKSARRIAQVLESAGISVDAVAAYQTSDVSIDVASFQSELDQRNSARGIVFTFFSPSAVHSLVRQCPEFARQGDKHTYVVTVGETTTAACEELGIQIDKMATMPSSSHVVAAIRSLFEPLELPVQS